MKGEIMARRTNKEIIKDVVDALKSEGASNVQIANLFTVRPVDILDIVDGTLSDDVESKVIGSSTFKDPIAFNVLINVIQGEYDNAGRNCHSCHFPGPSPLAMAIISLN